MARLRPNPVNLTKTSELVHGPYHSFETIWNVFNRMIRSLIEKQTVGRARVAYLHRDFDLTQSLPGWHDVVESAS